MTTECAIMQPYVRVLRVDCWHKAVRVREFTRLIAYPVRAVFVDLTIIANDKALRCDSLTVGTEVMCNRIAYELFEFQIDNLPGAVCPAVLDHLRVYHFKPDLLVINIIDYFKIAIAIF